jgi:hypothetical protein
LRPAVANMNSVRAGKARGLDIGRRRPSLEKHPMRPCGPDRSPKVPGWGEGVNEAAASFTALLREAGSRH